MAPGTKPFDVANHLEDIETIRYFLQDAFQEGDPADIANTVRAVVRARGGVARVATQTGLEEGVLEAELARDSGPDLATLLKILQSMELTLDAIAKTPQARAA